MKSSAKASDAVQIDVFGEACGSDGYTTPAEVRVMARHLGVKPGERVLDVGSGAGWPGLRVAEITGAHAVLTDVPRAGLASALERARSAGLAARCTAALASGHALPFRAGAMDAIVHADVMC
jgi:cyclopropane fatty-acyl-phospholipid synthase-like methyltransferase